MAGKPRKTTTKTTEKKVVKEEPVIEEKTPVDEVVFKCPQCNKKFNNKTKLNTHILTHYEEEM